MSSPATHRIPSGVKYALGLLVLVYMVNHVDRQIMFILIEPVRLDLGLSDSQMGMLTGAAFAIFYTFAGFPLARLADRGNRRNIISLALAVWSLMTLASGVARNFWQLMAARIGVSVGEAGCTPPAHSLISDYFPLSQRATAISIYQLGVPFGMLFGMAFGGYLAEEVGWRAAFFVVGVPGLVLAVVTRFTIREPVRGQSDPGASIQVEPLRDVLRFVLRLPSMRHMLIGSAVQTFALQAYGTWHAPFLMRVHEFDLKTAGLVLGLVAGAGAIPVFLGGWLGDRLSRRDLRWYWWLPTIGAVLSTPFSVVAYTTDSGTVAVAMIACATLGNNVYSAIGHAVTQSLAKPRMRAMTSSIALFAMNIVGLGLGPLVTGILSDAFGGEENIRYPLLILVAAMLWASVHYILGARTYAVDLEAKNE